MREKVKKKANFCGTICMNAIVLLRNHVDVVAAENEELRHLPHDVRRWLGHGMADDSIQGRLHRAGRNLEWLQKIRTNADRHDDGDENHFDVLAPRRFPRYRRELVQLGVELLRIRFDAVAIFLAQRFRQRIDAGHDLVTIAFLQHVLLVAQIFLRMPQEQLAVFYVTRLKHERQR